MLFVAFLGTMFALLFPLTARTAETAAINPSRAGQIYDSLSVMPSDVLLNDSRRWLEADTLSDMSVVALNIVANRYYQNEMDSAIRQQAIEALQMLGNIYMVRVMDYKKAYKSLWTARQIAEDTKNDYMLAGIYSSLANLYSVNPGDPARKTQKVAECLYLAAEAAMRSNNLDLLRTITVSMGVWSFPRKTWGEFNDLVHEIRNRYSANPRFKGPLLLIDACDSYFDGDTDAAERQLLDARGQLNFKKFSERYQYSLDLILSDLYAETGQYEKAIDLMKIDMAKAENEGHTDYLLNVYDQLKSLYQAADIPDSTDYYYLKYLKLKNEFSQRSSFGKIEEFDFLSQIDSINAKVEQLSLKRQSEERRNIIVIAILIVALVMLFSLLWAYINLKRNHRNLFERNREMLMREEQHRLLREQWEQERREYETLNPDFASETSDKELINDEDLESLKKVYTKILMIMEESRDIYNIGFSLTELANMVGQPYRVISKAINIYYGDNFHQLLNKYRLREATRLMHESDARTLTIEAIAENAGFKSRTSFATLFKKSMGMTPSEYWRIAREQ